MWNDSTTFVFFILDILGEYQFSRSVVSDFMTLRTACQASLSITNSWSLLKLMPSSQWCHQPSHPLSTPSPPAFYLSQHQGLFQWVGSSHQVAKVLELQLQNQSFNEYSGLISFRIDGFDLLAVQGTLKSLLQDHSSKASILWCSSFFIVQLSHLYMTAEITIALTRQTFVSNVMSLLFNMLSRFLGVYRVKLFWRKFFIWGSSDVFHF